MGFQFNKEMLIDSLAEIASKDCSIPYMQARREIEKTIQGEGSFFQSIGNISEAVPRKFDYSHIQPQFIEDWEQFISEEDILPNLMWLPSTHPNGCKVHEKYWNQIWAIRDSFWRKHHPGDCPNCQCSLTSTDKPATE